MLVKKWDFDLNLTIIDYQILAVAWPIFFSRPKFNLLCTQGEKCIAITVLPELHKCLFDVKKIFGFLYVILALKVCETS